MVEIVEGKILNRGSAKVHPGRNHKGMKIPSMWKVWFKVEDKRGIIVNLMVEFGRADSEGIRKHLRDYIFTGDYIKAEVVRLKKAYDSAEFWANVTLKKRLNVIESDFDLKAELGFSREGFWEGDF